MWVLGNICDQTLEVPKGPPGLGLGFGDIKWKNTLYKCLMKISIHISDNINAAIVVEPIKQVFLPRKNLA